MITPDNPPAVSEAAKARALELVLKASPTNEYRTVKEWEFGAPVTFGTLTRFIQEVSDAAKQVRNCPPSATPGGEMVASILAPFILPDPPDPLLIEAREMLAADHASSTSSWSTSLRR